MAIKTAEAALASSSICYAITGFIPYSVGELDQTSNSIRAIGVGQWKDLSGTTWAEFNQWWTTQKQIQWTSPLIDIGEIRNFNLTIQSEFDGSLMYKVYVSDTEDFHGPETEYILENGNLAVPSFYGRYVYVTAFLNGPELRRMTITSNTETVTYKLLNVDTSTLSGSAGNRLLSLPTPVSGITDINIECKAATPYAVNLYVSDTATSEILIPVVRNKTTSPSIGLFGIDNDARDGIVDITVSALPRQVFINGNLIVVA